MSKDEQIIYDYLNHTLESNSVVIAIGAYIGKVANNLCKNINGKPQNFHLIEACPTNFAILKKNCLDFNLYNLAISDVEGTISFYVKNHPTLEGSSQSNSLYKEFVNSKEWNKDTKVIDIKSMTIDSFIKMINVSHINLLQINCEGGEYKIFSQIPDCLDCVKFLYVQFHKKSKFFLSKDMTRLRNRIIDDLSKQFEMIIGDLNVDSHLHLLWRKK